MTRGIDATVGFQRLASGPREPVASGGFAFVRKGESAEDVRRRLINERALARGRPPNEPGVAFGNTRRNVIPWWSDTADGKFKSSAEKCLR